MLVREKVQLFQAEQWKGLISLPMPGVHCDGAMDDLSTYFVDTPEGRKRVVVGDWVVLRDNHYEVISALEFNNRYEDATLPVTPPLASVPAA